jgi:outer membrane protein assembly factor BamB
MDNEVNKNRWGSDRLWNRIAVVAGVFALLIGVLMISNFIQVKKADPINMTVINTLVERLSTNPADSALRTEIRTLDLLSRKAYFTSQWQIRTGGYILLLFVATMIIALQVVEYRKKITPAVPGPSVDDTMLQNRNTRRWILAGGSAILLTAVVFAILSSHDLAQRLRTESRGESASLKQDIESGNITVTDLAGSTADNVTGTPGTVQETDASEPAETGTAPDSSSPGTSSTVNSDNYPNFRGAVGTASKRNIPVNWDGVTGTNVLWKTALPLPGHNSPIVWGDKVFATGASTEKQEIYCFDRNNGKILWTVPVGTNTKKPTVSEETGYAAPSAVTDGSGVYAIFATGDIAGVDMNGRKIWEKDLGLPDNHYGHASSLIVADGKIIVQLDQSSSQKILALSTKSGETLWSTDRPVKTSWSSPIVVNSGKRTEIITAAEPFVAAYNPANGQELWKIECISGEVGPSLAYANGIVFAVNDYSKLSAIKLGDQPSILWQNDEYLSDIPSPAATDKYLFLVTSYGTAVCYDAATGQKYWENDFGKSIFASPMIVENKVYLLDITGVMHIFAADKEFRLIGEPRLGEYSACTSAFTNGRIYIKGEENLYCIGE